MCPRLHTVRCVDIAEAGGEDVTSGGWGQTKSHADKDGSDQSNPHDASAESEPSHLYEANAVGVSERRVRGGYRASAVVNNTRPARDFVRWAICTVS